MYEILCQSLEGMGAREKIMSNSSYLSFRSIRPNGGAGIKKILLMH